MIKAFTKGGDCILSGPLPLGWAPSHLVLRAPDTTPQRRRPRPREAESRPEWLVSEAGTRTGPQACPALATSWQSGKSPPKRETQVPCVREEGKREKSS